ncbi:RagB/SusD family nutrient uptake outer membrane protein [Halosquirtibacter xylanolyticus]|uniref:RagB/SusD family nutrient uptake outer membrane protein n=1 Tax=Halosquirtibacter xylanolyticus TaxID=3374599 RepID=UPI003749FAB2|nr:RagB/SusD family nutrient uptake outer membrane protein [Prolixibacteraceae bacterium]
MKYMNNINRSFLIIAALFFMGSCSTLEFDETSGLVQKEDVYKYFDRTTSMLNYLYTFIPQDFSSVGGAPKACATDDAEFGQKFSGVQFLTNGSWSALNLVDYPWDKYYKGIRAANGFIKEIDNVDLTRYQYDNGYGLMMKKLPTYVYQARLLRAYYFFELARRYGDIPMPLDVLTIEEANSITKTKFSDVIDFVVKECDEVVPNLPLSYKELSKEYGRMNKGFAMALKTKALLFRASALHNSSNDKKYWERCAEAAHALIDSSETKGWYGLAGVLTAMNKYDAKDVIMFRQNGPNSTFEKINFPVRLTDGKSSTTGVCPSQNLVDAFETVNGEQVILTDQGWESKDPTFDKERPYENRDPRFYKTIVTNGMKFKDITIEAYEGGRERVAVSEGGTATGYFLRKYIDETTSFDPNKLVKKRHTWIIYRYAEVLLSYAESMIEAFDDPDYTDTKYTRSARWAINQVRQNAGMPTIETSNKSEFIKKLRNEWRVEFAFEGHRFWDIRRWKIGAETQTRLYGVSITNKDDGSQQYQRQLYETRYWDNKMNLYPIKQSELFANPNLQPQNQGW